MFNKKRMKMFSGYSADLDSWIKSSCHVRLGDKFSVVAELNKFLFSALLAHRYAHVHNFNVNYTLKIVHWKIDHKISLIDRWLIIINCKQIQNRSLVSHHGYEAGIFI